MVYFSVKFEQHQINAETTCDTFIQEILDESIVQFNLNKNIEYGLFRQDELLHNETSLLENYIKEEDTVMFILKPINGQVQVQHKNKVYKVICDINLQCEVLYNQIEKQLNLQKFTLEFKENLLEKHLAVKDYGIIYNSIILVNYDNVLEMNSTIIFNIYFQGQHFNHIVSNILSVRELEQEIKDKFNISGQIILSIQNGAELQTNQLLQEYHLPQEVVLIINIKTEIESLSTRFILLNVEYQNVRVRFQIEKSKPLSYLEQEIRQLFFIQQQFCLLFDEQMLPLNKTIDQLGLQNNSKLIIQKQTIIIIIQYSVNEVILEVDATAQVSEIIDFLKSELGLYVTLNYKGQILESKLQLQQINLNHKQLNYTSVEGCTQEICLTAQNPLVLQANFLQPDYRVFILINNKELVKINLQPGTPILELEQYFEVILQQKVGIFYQDKQLQSNYSLFKQQIPADCHLELNFLNDQIQVFSPFQTRLEEKNLELIVNVLGENLHVKVSAESLISDFMDIIKEEKKIHIITELIGENILLKPYLSFRQQGVVSGTNLILREVDKDLIITKTNFHFFNK